MNVQGTTPLPGQLQMGGILILILENLDVKILTAEFNRT
jgi:hypothetical protein